MLRRCAGVLPLLLFLCARAASAAEPEPGSVANSSGPSDPAWQALEILGERVEPGERRRVVVHASESFGGGSLPTPVYVVRGKQSGPTLCLIGGVHGDELNGTEVVRRALEKASPDRLRGTLVGVPIANLHGFRRSSRYLPDRRDLNRFFPGNPTGSAASRIAHALFEGVVRNCEMLVDFHTGSFHRANLPHVRGDLTRPGVADLAADFGSDLVLHKPGMPGTLRRAAMDEGIAAILYEGGEPMRLSEPEVERGVAGVEVLLSRRGMLAGKHPVIGIPRVYHAARWVRVDAAGILLAHVKLGDAVEAGDLLGTVTDPISNARSDVRSSDSGRLIGVAANQVVIPGFAAFHLGLDAYALPPGVPPEAAELWPMDSEGGDPYDSLEVDERPE